MFERIEIKNPAVEHDEFSPLPDYALELFVCVGVALALCVFAVFALYIWGRL